MNFVFISPHFPHTYWNFCQRLKQNGVTVLGIADAPYEGLPQGEVGDEEILCRGLGAYSATFIVTGCSMGGFHAGNFFFRRPDLFDTLLAPDRDYVI